MINDNKLYNVIFPIWLLLLLPAAWIIVLPTNFLIDLLVIVLTLKVIKAEGIFAVAKSIILKVWIFGFIADLIGSAVMLTSNIIDFDYQTPLGKWWYENITNAVSYNPFSSIYAIVWVTICVVIAGVLIYLFNYKFCLNKAGLEEIRKKKLAISLAVFTAPYIFFVPTSWFF